MRLSIAPVEMTIGRELIESASSFARLGASCLLAAALEFAGFDDDEVLVDRLEGGAGEAWAAVEDGSAEEDQVEPLDDGAAGKAIEDGLLVDAAGVKVGVAEGGPEGWGLQDLLAVNDLGFERGVAVVLVEPVGDAF